MTAEYIDSISKGNIPAKITDSYIVDFDVIGTQISYIDIDDKLIGRPNLQTNDLQIKQLSLKGNNQVANTSVIFKKKDALEVGGWREDIDGIEDFDFWLKLMRSNKKFININEILVKHRLHSNSNFNTKKYNLSSIL